jgi:hypothetical protein
LLVDNNILDIPGYGNMSAVVMCERLDIKSSKDTEKLKKAKEEVYLKGFYEGVMIVGECKGMKVGSSQLRACISLLNPQIISNQTIRVVFHSF